MAGVGVGDFGGGWAAQGSDLSDSAPAEHRLRRPHRKCNETLLTPTGAGARLLLIRSLVRGSHGETSTG